MQYIKINYFIMPYEDYPIWPGTRSHVLNGPTHAMCVKVEPTKLSHRPTRASMHLSLLFSYFILIFLLPLSLGPRVSFIAPFFFCFFFGDNYKMLLIPQLEYFPPLNPPNILCMKKCQFNYKAFDNFIAILAILPLPLPSFQHHK